MTAKSILKGALPVFVGVAGIALTIRYFGDKPLIEDVAKGLQGDVVGLFK